MTETRVLLNEFGQQIEYIVQARFYVDEQEYLALSEKLNILRDVIFLRVEVDIDGTERLVLPIYSEWNMLKEHYRDLNKNYN